MDLAYKNMAEGNKKYLMKLMSVIYGKEKFKKIQSTSENDEDIDILKVVNNNGVSATIKSLNNAMQISLDGTDFASLIYSDEEKNYYRYCNDNFGVYYDIYNGKISEDVSQTRAIKRIQDLILSTEYYKCGDFIIVSKFVQTKKNGEVHLALNNTEIDEMNDEKIIEYMLDECENAKSIDFEEEQQFPQDNLEEVENSTCFKESNKTPKRILIDKDGFIYYKEKQLEENENLLENHELNLPTVSSKFDYRKYVNIDDMEIEEEKNEEDLSYEYADEIDSIICDLLSISPEEAVFSKENDAYRVGVKNNEITDEEIKQNKIEKVYRTVELLNDEIVDIIDFINDIDNCKQLSEKTVEMAKNRKNIQTIDEQNNTCNTAKEALNNSKRGVTSEIYLDRMARIIENKENYSLAKLEDGIIVTITSKNLYDEEGNEEEIIDGKDTVYLVKRGDNIIASLKNSNYNIIIGAKDDNYLIKNKGLKVTKKIINKKLEPDIHIRYISDKIGTESFTALYLVKNIEQVLIYLNRQDNFDPQNLMDLTISNKKLIKSSYNDLLTYAKEEMDDFYPIDDDDNEIDNDYMAESINKNTDSVNSERKNKRKTAVVLPDNDEDFIRFCNYEEDEEVSNNDSGLDFEEMLQLDSENMKKIQEYLDENEVFLHGKKVNDYLEKQALLADVYNLIECENTNLINLVNDINTITNGYNEIENELNQDGHDKEDSFNR